MIVMYVCIYNPSHLKPFATLPCKIYDSKSSVIISQGSVAKLLRCGGIFIIILLHINRRVRQRKNGETLSTVDEEVFK